MGRSYKDRPIFMRELEVGRDNLTRNSHLPLKHLKRVKFKMNIDFTTIDQNDDGYYEQKSSRQMVIDNPEQWRNFWEQHTCHICFIDDPVYDYDLESLKSTPQVDFNSYSVVAVFAGEKPSTGYSVRIVSVETSDSQFKDLSSIVITFQDLPPEGRRLVGHMMTYPYHIIRIPKIGGHKVVFKNIGVD
jgi:hypothetical protein